MLRSSPFWFSGNVSNYEYGFVRSINGTTGKIKEDNRLFPFDKSTPNRRWNKLLEKAKLTEKENQSKKNIRILHLYSLRSFFRTNFGNTEDHETP